MKRNFGRRFVLHLFLYKDKLALKINKLIYWSHLPYHLLFLQLAFILLLVTYLAYKFFFCIPLKILTNYRFYSYLILLVRLEGISLEIYHACGLQLHYYFLQTNFIRIEVILTYSIHNFSQSSIVNILACVLSFNRLCRRKK